MIPAAIERAINAPATASEVRRALEQPIDAGERQEVLSLVRWFTRRYPTPADRLAYVRQAYARWRRAAPQGRPASAGLASAGPEREHERRSENGEG